MSIVVMPSKFVKTFNNDALRSTHILIVIAKDRTGVLKGERIDILESGEVLVKVLTGHFFVIP
ncbi:hypothetical protein vBSflM004_088 [Shigella phage vB_SflM_004]|nr:hypothetical protein vBSflM004_088 [Shigella phage vB_SflM_004]